MTIEISGDGVITKSGSGAIALRPCPVFSVPMTNDQTGIAGSTSIKVAFDTVDYDSNSYWDAINYRYTPQIAGYYQFNAILRCEVSGGQSTLMRVALYKNGSALVSSYLQANTSVYTNSHVPISYLIYCNGSSDYVETYGYISTGTTTSRAFGGTEPTVGPSAFSGFLVRPD